MGSGRLGRHLGQHVADFLYIFGEVLCLFRASFLPQMTLPGCLFGVKNQIVCA